MQRSLELEVVADLLDIVANQTVDLTDRVHREPVENYTDAELWTSECEQLFRRGPIVAGLSGELPEPGCWKLFDETGVPIVLVRGEDGVMRGFLNVCGHRGARLVEQPHGRNRMLSCPFHGWSYRTDGTLAAVPRPTTFAGACLDDRDLRPVQVQERHGMIWVVARPGEKPMDLDAHLGPFGAELDHWNVADWQHLETRVHTIAGNWKLTTDTFTEGYHIPVLHKDSIGPLIAGGLNAHATFGDHHREVFAMANLEELRDLPREEWNAFDEERMIFTYDIYPNTILQIGGDHVEMYRIFPGAEVGSSICMHSLFSFEKVDTEEERERFRATFDFFYALVGNEDFRVVAGIQKGLATGAYPTYLYGRMEPVTQAWHAGYRRDTRGLRS